MNSMKINTDNKVRSNPNTQFYICDLYLEDKDLLGNVVQKKCVYSFIVRLADLRLMIDCLGPNASLSIYTYPEGVPYCPF